MNEVDFYEPVSFGWTPEGFEIRSILKKWCEPMQLAAQEKIDEIIQLKRKLLPRQERLSDDDVKEIINGNELFNMGCLSDKAADELIESLKERYDYLQNAHERHQANFRP